MSIPSAPSRVRTAALTAAVLGGAAAVAAEVVFTRRMSVLFGVTAPAVAVYLLGMAIGSVFGGRLADRLGARAGWTSRWARRVASQGQPA